MNSVLRRLLPLFTAAVCYCLVCGAAAQEQKSKEPKEETLKGTLCCALCELNLNLPYCLGVIVVKEPVAKAGTVYAIDKKGDAKFGVEDRICVESWEGKVTGVIGGDLKDKDDKVLKDKNGKVVQLITVSDVTFFEKK